jgi:hypothetical protein
MARKITQSKVAATLNLEAQLRSVLERALKSHARKHIPLVYKDNRCVRPNDFIHEYPDGRKFLIRQSLRSSKETVLRELK